MNWGQDKDPPPLRHKERARYWRIANALLQSKKVIPGRRLLLVENEPLSASLLSEALISAGFEVLVAESAVEAVRAAPKFDPDIALLDIDLGLGPTGVDLAHVLNVKHPGIALMMLTRHQSLISAGYSPEDLPAGCGFIRKDLITDSQAIVDFIDAVVAKSDSIRQDAHSVSPLDVPTSSQLQVLKLVAQGYTNTEIASQRNITVRGVEQSLKSVYQALKIEDQRVINPRVEAVRYFITASGTPERA